VIVAGFTVARLIVGPVRTPGGLDAREDEGGRLDGRERPRQDLVFKERERLDTLGRGQVVDQSRQELLGIHGTPSSSGEGPPGMNQESAARAGSAPVPCPGSLTGVDPWRTLVETTVLA